MHAAAPRERVERGAGDERAGQRGERDGSGAAGRRRRSARPPPATAPPATPTTSGETSGLRVTCWKTAPAMPSAAPASSAVERARQPQVEHDEVVGLVARAGERGDDVERRHGELAERDARDERGERERRERGGEPQRPDGRAGRRRAAAQDDRRLTAPPAGAGGRAR